MKPLTNQLNSLVLIEKMENFFPGFSLTGFFTILISTEPENRNQL